MAKKSRCKCFYSGESGWNDEFVRKPVGKQYRYFKSEEVYAEYLKEKEKQQELNNKKQELHMSIATLLNYKFLPPFLLKKINELTEYFDLEVVAETFRQQKDTIDYWLNQGDKFKSEAGKVNYMMAIIKNNIIEVDKQWKLEQKRKQPSKVNIDIDAANEIYEINYKDIPKKKDSISKFLD